MQSTVLRSGFFIACAFALTCFSAAQDLSKPMTYTSRALPLRQVLADLSAQSGTKLSATDDMASEPLILRVDNSSIQSVVDKIAEVFQADWVKTQNGMRLQRSKEKVDAIEKADIADRAKRIGGGIESQIDLEKQNGSLTPAAAEDLVKSFLQPSYNGLGEQVRPSGKIAYARTNKLPSYRLGVALLACFDPKELASLPHDRRTVFSSDPLPLQQPMPSGFDPNILHQFVEDRATLAAAYKKLVTDESQPDEQLKLDATELSASPAKIIMSVPPQGKFFEADIEVLDSSDKTLGNCVIGFFGSSDDELKLAAELKQARADVTKNGFPLGPVGAELAPHFHRYRPNDQTAIRQVPQPILDQLLHPTKQDPLSFAASDTVLTGAELAHKNAICLLNDYAEYDALRDASVGKTTLDLFRKEVELDENVIDADEDDWIVVRPVHPCFVASQRVPRDVLETMLQKIYVDHFISLEDAGAALAKVASRAEILSAAMSFDQTNSDRALIESPDITRLYGLLADDERQAANESGFSAALGTLTEEEQRQIMDHVLEQGTYLGSPGRFLITDDSVAQDATEHLPQGVPPSSLVTLRVESNPTPVFVMENPDGTCIENPGELDSLANYIFMARSHQQYPMASKLLGVRPSTQRILHFRLDVDKNLYFESEVREAARASGDPIPAEDYLAKLSERDRATVEAKVQEMQKRIKLSDGCR